MIENQVLVPTRNTKNILNMFFRKTKLLTIPVQLINTSHFIFPCDVRALVTRSYCPARCFSVRISSTGQSSIILTPKNKQSN